MPMPMLLELDTTAALLPLLELVVVNVSNTI